jgi:hypothetical protein
MSGWREDAEERNYATAWIVWGVGILVVLILGWAFILRPLLVSKDAETLQDSYGAQQAKIAGARQAVVAFNASDDEGQRQALANQACALIVDINDKPQDLVAFSDEEC